MPYGQILPDYLESGLVVGYRCPGCGRMDGWFQLHVPQLTLSSDGSCVRIVYPVQCSCGRHGHVSTRLPILLYGYLLARVQILEARKSRKQPKQVKPARSQLLDKFIRDFESAIDHYASVRSTIEGTRPSEHHTNRPRSPNEPSELDRLSFGLDDDSWRDFLKRLGLSEDDQENADE
jgi:hypothetical protein